MLVKELKAQALCANYDSGMTALDAPCSFVCVGKQRLTTGEHRMATTSYARDLRAIGQSLEAQRIQKFELKISGELFQITGEPEQEPNLLSVLRHWQRQLRRAALSDTHNYSSQDIQQLDRQGRANRLQGGRLPDLYSLPNILRTVGAYLDSQKARLITLNKQPLSLNMLYRDRLGFPQLEERTVASFHSWLIELHREREKK